MPLSRPVYFLAGLLVGILATFIIIGSQMLCSNKHFYRLQTNTHEMVLNAQKASNNTIKYIYQKCNESGTKNTTESKPTTEQPQYHERSTILEASKIPYLIREDGLCLEKNVTLVIYIHSAAANKQRRDRIRTTWANVKYYKNVTRVLIFVIGRNKNVPQNDLFLESKEHHDIIQFDFQDSYYNLTYTSLGALRWINSHCSHVKYVLKTDDDCLVNTFHLLQELRKPDPYEYQSGNDSQIVGYYLPKPPVERRGKWAVAKVDYKDPYFPPYCAGLAFIFSGNVSTRLYKASFLTYFLWVDDVYTTGTLAKAANITHRQIKDKMLMHETDLARLLRENKKDKVFEYWFMHIPPPDLYKRTWSEMISYYKME